MNVNDIKKRCNIGELNDFLLEEMNSTASRDLIDRMSEVLGADGVIEWYYSKRSALSNRRPYDCCRQGNDQEIYQLLGRIEHGIF